MSIVKAFEAHGLDIPDGTEADEVNVKADCIFCGKERHLFLNKDTGEWDCKRCGRKGNVYSFIRQVWECAQEDTGADKLKKLSELRNGIPAQAMKDFGIAHAPYGWLIPVWNMDGGFSNLITWNPNQPPLGTPGLVTHLFGGQEIPSFPKEVPVYVCEGPWDAISLRWLQSRVGFDGVIVGVPGANTFKRQWVDVFEGRDVYLLYDNDSAGEKGVRYANEQLGVVPKSVHSLRWPAGMEEGYDIQDLVIENKRRPKRLWSSIQKMLHPVAKHKETKQRKRDTPPPPFKKVVETYRKYLYLDENMVDALAAVYATVFSVQLPGDPLWMFLVGPPGVGKTVVLRSLEAHDRCVFQSNVTPHTLISGFRTPDGQDPSLIPRLKNNVLIVKDYTEVKSLPLGIQEELYGMLRGAYDGKVERRFGNNEERIYEDCYFSMVAGVTDVIHGDARATLGERFIKCEFLDAKMHDMEAHIKAALDSMDQLREMEAETAEVASDFLDREIELDKVPKLPKWIQTRLIPLSQIVAYLRAGIHRTRDGDVPYRQRPEVGTRVIRQLKKLVQSLAIVFDLRTPDHRCYRIAEKIAIDSSIGWYSEIVRALYDHGSPMTREELSAEVRIPATSLHRRLEDLLQLEALSRDTRMEEGVRRGRPTFEYKLSPHLESLWRRAKVGILPKATPKGRRSPNKPLRKGR